MANATEVTQQFREIWAAKTAAKQTAFVAMQQAKRNDANGQPSSDEWSTQVEYGIKGIEGEKHAEAQKLADDTYREHPEWFAFFVDKNQAEVVDLVSSFRGLGLEHDATLATMYEMAKYERRNVEGTVETKLRIAGIGG